MAPNERAPAARTARARVDDQRRREADDPANSAKPDRDQHRPLDAAGVAEELQRLIGLVGDRVGRIDAVAPAGFDRLLTQRDLNKFWILGKLCRDRGESFSLSNEPPKGEIDDIMHLLGDHSEAIRMAVQTIAAWATRAAAETPAERRDAEAAASAKRLADHAQQLAQTLGVNRSTVDRDIGTNVPPPTGNASDDKAASAAVGTNVPPELSGAEAAARSTGRRRIRPGKNFMRERAIWRNEGSTDHTLSSGAVHLKVIIAENLESRTGVTRDAQADLLAMMPCAPRHAHRFLRELVCGGVLEKVRQGKEAHYCPLVTI